MDKTKFYAWYNSLPADVKEDICPYAAWKGWKASRAAIKITDPAGDFETGYAYADEIISQIVDAGISYE